LRLSTGMTLEAWVNPSAVSSVWRDVIYKGNDNYYLEGPRQRLCRSGWTFGKAAEPGLAANTWLSGYLRRTRCAFMSTGCGIACAPRHVPIHECFAGQETTSTANTSGQHRRGAHLQHGADATQIRRTRTSMDRRHFRRSALHRAASALVINRPTPQQSAGVLLTNTGNANLTVSSIPFGRTKFDFNERSLRIHSRRATVASSVSLSRRKLPGPNSGVDHLGQCPGSPHDLVGWYWRRRLSEPHGSRATQARPNSSQSAPAVSPGRSMGFWVEPSRQGRSRPRDSIPRPTALGRIP
jgi:hypothetical protein